MNFEGGDSWEYDDQGLVLIDGKAPRTKGDPITAHTIFLAYQNDIFEACKLFNVSPSLLIALIAKESLARKKSGGHRNNISIRLEPGYESDKKTPRKISAGLMQTLLSTAQDMNDRFDLFQNYMGLTRQLNRYDLMSPRESILLGAAYLNVLEGKWGSDPMLLQAAYNAGGVKVSSQNRWNIRMFGKRRFENFAAYYNDAMVMLRKIYVETS